MPSWYDWFGYTDSLKSGTSAKSDVGGGDSFSDANAFNAGEAQKQRDFEERMFKTRYQNSVADMRAAGMNPLLLAGGQPPTPGGASAGSVTPNYDKQNVPTRKFEAATGAASALASIWLTRESAKTQQTQQKLNLANASMADRNKVSGGWLNNLGNWFKGNSAKYSAGTNSASGSQFHNPFK